MNDMTLYNSIAKPPRSLLPVETLQHTPVISRKDIENGEITRYFCRKTNHKSAADILEVSKQTYDSIKLNSMYSVVEMRWIIKGRVLDIMDLTNPAAPVRLYTGVTTSNKLFVSQADKEMPGLKNIITDYIKFWQGE